jgi:hypothetical protein
VPALQGFKENWLRPFLFYGNNPVSLIGGALTSASALVLIGYWVVDLLGKGGSDNPYLGIIFDFILPGLFVLGLLLIPAGIFLRRRALLAAGQVPSIYPQIDFRDPVFRHGIDFVVVATFINFVILGTASYRGVAYMDTPSFCGQACHVMAPEWGAYHVARRCGLHQLPHRRRPARLYPRQGQRHQAALHGDHGQGSPAHHGRGQAPSRQRNLPGLPQPRPLHRRQAFYQDRLRRR